MATDFGRHAKLFTETLNKKLEPQVQEHLKNVYMSLSLASLAAAGGATFGLYTGSFGLLAVLGALASGIALTFSENNYKNQNKRFGYFMAFAGFTGLSLAPLIGMAIYLNPRIIPFSLISTFLVFGSFTMSALFSNHAKWLFVGGGLFSMLSIMTFMSIANIFIGSYYLFQAQLYIGIVVFCLFVMYDTAYIIERRRAGDKDYLQHSMRLFVDMVDIFRTLMILMIQKERNNRNNRNRR